MASTGSPDHRGAREAVSPQSPYREDDLDVDPDTLLRQLATSRAVELIEWCSESGLTISTAESLTGGMIAAALSVIPGAGDVLKGAAVTYRSETKHDVLGVRPGPVVTAAAAAEMALGAISLFSSDLAVAVTGVAGPDRQENVPVGTVFLAVTDNRSPTLNQIGQFTGSPSDVRVATVRAAIDLLAGFVRRREAEPYQATSEQPR